MLDLMIVGPGTVLSVEVEGLLERGDMGGDMGLGVGGVVLRGDREAHVGGFESKTQRAGFKRR